MLMSISRAVRHLVVRRGLAATSAVAAAPPPPALRRFGEQRLRPWLASALRQSNFVAPLPIQSAAMDAIAHHQDTVIHAETGSGKTLAYLVPMLSRLEPGVPLQQLILAPSRELALQVARQAHALVSLPDAAADATTATTATAATTRRPSVALVVGQSRYDALSAPGDLARDIARGNADLVIATPEALRRALFPRRQPSTPYGAPMEASRGAPSPPAAAQAVPFFRLPNNPMNMQPSVGAAGEGGGAAANAARAGGGRADDDAPSASSSSSVGGAVDNGPISRQLVETLAANLDAIVLDEVDALLPKPVLKERLGYFRQRDWAKAQREQRASARADGGMRSPAASVVRQILAAVEATRRADGAGAGKARWRMARSRRHDAGGARRSPRVHMVAASATVGRGVLMQLKRLFALPRPPPVIGADGQVTHVPHGVVAPHRAETDSPAAAAALHAVDEAGGGGRHHAAAAEAPPATREHGLRGVASVGVPRRILHYVRPLGDGEEAAVAVDDTVRRLGARVALAVLPDETPLRPWLHALRDAGLPRAAFLHEVLGFPTRDQAAAPLSGQSLKHLVAAGAPSATAGPAARGGARPAAAAADEDSPLLLLTTERSVRGLDLPGLDCVVLLYAPKTSDTYVHLAGRTGRAGHVADRANVVSVLGEREAGRLGLFSSQLGIRIKPWPRDE